MSISLITLPEEFTDEERSILSRFFTNTDRPVFGLKQLPEVVKGALFARYSRSPKSLRRLFLDEFYGDRSVAVERLGSEVAEGGAIGKGRAEQLYDRIFSEYGDDSVAQLGGAHIACEQASNVLTKVLERGRLAAYLEQSTRYILFDQKVADHYRYQVPSELRNTSLDTEFNQLMEMLFDAYAHVIRAVMPLLEHQFPREPNDAVGVWRATLRAKACDVARGLLPASTMSNVGIYASGQAYEGMLLRMFASPLAEVRTYAEWMLAELRELVPSFVKRVDQEHRGVAWSKYLQSVQGRMREFSMARESAFASFSDGVQLTDWDPDGEAKVIAAGMYEHTNIPETSLLRMALDLSEGEKDLAFSAMTGVRTNRRHKPGRAFERTSYRFDIVCDYGAFRDLQRHRMLTIQWQHLGVDNGYDTPAEIETAGASALWHECMAAAARLHSRIAAEHGPLVAQYSVPLAYRIRFVLQMNAREAIHLLELRSQRQGHPSYRRIAQVMHSLIRDKAQHRRIAETMQYVDHAEYDLERLESERRTAARRASSSENVVI